MNTINEESKLDESDDEKYGDDFVYPSKCWDYVLNYVFGFLWI